VPLGSATLRLVWKSRGPSPEALAPMSCAPTTIRGRRRLILAFDLRRAAACDFVPSLQEEHLHTRTLCTAVTLTISWPLSFLFLITHTICIILLDGSGWSAFDTKAVATPQGTGCLSNFATRTHALAPAQLQYNTHAIRTRTFSAHAISHHAKSIINHNGFLRKAASSYDLPLPSPSQPLTDSSS
jgi:hypothetical protein